MPNGFYKVGVSVLSNTLTLKYCLTNSEVLFDQSVQHLHMAILNDMLSLLGGSFHVAKKHSEAVKVNYRSGFFITTNVMPDFGHESDQDAIMKRLTVYKTKTLPKKDSSVTGTWLFSKFIPGGAY